jgi:hypothetical protein
MECARFVEEKVSGEASPEFREHLEACAASARDLEDYADVRRLYREASVERWKGAGARPSRSRFLASVPVAAAALLMVGVLVLLLGSPDAAPPTPNPEPIPFTRIHLESWDRTETRIVRAVDDVWRRLDEIERSSR